jgi:hypothetical protein
VNSEGARVYDAQSARALVQCSQAFLYVAGMILVIPLGGETAVSFAFPVFGDFVVFFQGARHEMFGISLLGVLDTKIVDHEQKDDW